MNKKAKIPTVRDFFKNVSKENKRKLIIASAVIICIVAVLITLLLVFRVSERYDLLYEVEQNGLTFCARGKGDRVKQLVVKENGEVIWAKRVKTDREMGKIDDTYGLSVQDLDFDGYDDILIATAKDGDCISYACYVRVGAKPQYNLWDKFEGLYNIKADARLGAIFAFEQSVEARGNNAYLRTDKTVKYLWKDGELVPDMYAAIHYYSGGDQTPYCYAVAYYDEELGKFLDSSDDWLTKEEYENRDWSFLYYFK